MSLIINNNNGTINHIENSVVTISNDATTAIPHEQPAPQTEDIRPVETAYFCRITPHAIDSGHAQEVEDDLRSAAVSAPKLVKAIKTNEALGYLDTKNLPSTDLYDMLNRHFGLKFKLRTFQDYRSR